ncbi:hypothetical protein RISK_002832 [Rhodopirellula islandica]|uniref:Transmembrane protein n=1 Tax=Rhodopirellula islandica TaxID=595434 RepID=A0A0J1BEW7_RHOIS|nr:hypothetical protein [Rhodopirellula islandica]KLU05070.1 hypothetical protein RISK_002832 [Rhodopirellula islandica]
MSMEENPYSPSTLDVDDASSVPILNRVVCYALAVASAGGFLLAALLVLATILRVMRFAFFVPASLVLFYVVAIVLYVGIAYGFIVAVKKSLRMEVRPALKWLAGGALSFGFVMRYCALCAKEVQVDEDERCTECGWPI